MLPPPAHDVRLLPTVPNAAQCAAVIRDPVHAAAERRCERRTGRADAWEAVPYAMSAVCDAT